MNNRILIVDDDVMNLKMAEFVLKQNGYETVTADSGMACLLTLREEPFDLILLDIEMPIMSGFKTLEIIKENVPLADIPVIFLTAAAEMENVREAGMLGAADYIRKPFMAEELLKRVRKALDS